MSWNESYVGKKTESYHNGSFKLDNKFLLVPLINNQFTAFPQHINCKERSYNIIALYNPFITEKFPSGFSGDLILVEPDSRITLPEHLDDFLGLDGQITIIGVGKRLELWSPQDYDRYDQGDKDIGKFLKIFERERIKEAKKGAWKKIRQNYQTLVKRGLIDSNKSIDDWTYSRLEFMDTALEITMFHQRE